MSSQIDLVCGSHRHRRYTGDVSSRQSPPLGIGGARTGALAGLPYDGDAPAAAADAHLLGPDCEHLGECWVGDQRRVTLAEGVQGQAPLHHSSAENHLPVQRAPRHHHTWPPRHSFQVVIVGHRADTAHSPGGGRPRPGGLLAMHDVARVLGRHFAPHSSGLMQ